MKKEKLKYYLKKNLISFIIGLILFGSIGVYAVINFYSKDVKYENKTSGLSSNNVQEAIDELYEICTAIPAPGDTILDSTEIVSSGDGLYKDIYEDGRYFYKGKNVNNYVSFNNETWRIISIEPDKTIKIMRENGINVSNLYWDTAGSNNWSRPASLNTYLNGTYLSGMTQAAQSQIVAKDFSIGAVTNDNSDLADQINDENSRKWNGKVALATVSEYIRSNSNQSSCGTHSKNEDNYSSCKNTTWMFNNSYWWTLSPYNGFSSYAFRVGSDGSFGYGFVDRIVNRVRPAVYLSSDVQITGGDGSQNNMYTLSQ